MNYFINLIPNTNFLEKITETESKLKNNDTIILNMYIKNLPAMNIYKNTYINYDEIQKYMDFAEKHNCKINLMLDTFCFGNKEFTKNGKQVLEMLDKIFCFNVDYITVCNNFFFNYVKRRYPNIKIIISEYNEITNIQKISRYIEEMRADAVKIDTKLALNLENMKYIKDNFNAQNIHIDINKTFYYDDIFKDSLNNNLSHFIQEERWEEINQAIQEYENLQSKQNKMKLSNENIENLKKLGFINYWCSLEQIN